MFTNLRHRADIKLPILFSLFLQLRFFLSLPRGIGADLPSPLTTSYLPLNSHELFPRLIPQTFLSHG